MNILNRQNDICITCPLENCLNMPEIYFTNTIIKSEIKFKCICQNNRNTNMELKEFLEKSSFICDNCGKYISKTIIYCNDCKAIICHNCKEFWHKYHLNNNICNFCQKHNKKYLVRCINCNKSFCNFCDIDSHDSNGHDIRFLSGFSVSENDKDKIYSSFEKQKQFLEKIKNINNNFIQSLENDIQIKERIINNYQNNKYNYNSILNLKNLNIQNNIKYENILKNIIQNNNSNKNKENNTVKKFVNNFLSMLYYSFMINKDQSINESIIKCLINELTNLNSNNNDIILIQEDKEENIKNNFTNELSSNKIDVLNLKHSFKEKSLNEGINKIYYNYKNIEKNDIYLNNNLNANINKNIKNFPKDKILLESNINRDLSDSDSKTFSVHINCNESSKSKNDKELNSKENNIINLEEENKKFFLNDSGINHMIILKSGNIALSRKKVIEIYDLQKLNYSNGDEYYSNKDIIYNCLIQQIQLTKKTNINYIFELYDQTLLCATYGMIIRVKLKNNDTENEIFGYLALSAQELPTKIISLENQFLVILSERNDDIFLKLYKNNNIENNELNNNNLLKNSIDCAAVPAIGNNYSILNKQKINEDNSFELMINNFNEKKNNLWFFLWLSLFPIEKNKNKFDKYLYEFIATSNSRFYYGADKIVFFGLFQDGNDTYKVEKIKEISNISCSDAADSICKINEKFVCIGLQYKNSDAKISGFALIDIYKRELNKIIKDDNIYSICYDINNKILLASVKIGKNKNGKYVTKIYEIKDIKDEKGNDEVDFNEIVEYESYHTKPVSSIQSLYNARKERILITSSFDSTLQAVKIVI